MKALIIALLIGLFVVGCVSQGGNATPTPYATPVPTVDSPPSPPAVDASATEGEIGSGLDAAGEEIPTLPGEELTVTEEDLGA